MILALNSSPEGKVLPSMVRWYIVAALVAVTSLLPHAGAAIRGPSADRDIGPATPWEVWWHDSFDHDSKKDIEGTDMQVGSQHLWRKTLHEGVTKEGGETFTSFSLHWTEPNGHKDFAEVRVRTPWTGQTYAKFRRWGITDPGGGTLIQALGECHLRLLRKRPRGSRYGAEESNRILELVARAASRDELIAFCLEAVKT